MTTILSANASDTLTQQTYNAISDSEDSGKQHWGWERFDRRFRPRAVWRCLRRGLSHADADDCAGTVMVKMLDHAPNFYDSKGRSRQTHSFCAFLNCVTDRQASDFRQANGRICDRETQWSTLDQLSREHVDGEYQEFDTLDLERGVDSMEDCFEESLLLALKELCRRRNPSTVRAFLLKTMTDMTWEEVAEETGLKPNTAMKAHERCRVFLSDLLGEADADSV